MYDENRLQPLTPWLHVKTGHLYVVLGVGVCGTNDDRNGERAVVYHRDGSLYYRDVAEFLDGRFVPIRPQDRVVETADDKFETTHP